MSLTVRDLKKLIKDLSDNTEVLFYSDHGGGYPEFACSARIEEIKFPNDNIEDYVALDENETWEDYPDILDVPSQIVLSIH